MGHQHLSFGAHLATPICKVRAMHTSNVVQGRGQNQAGSDDTGLTKVEYCGRFNQNLLSSFNETILCILSAPCSVNVYNVHKLNK